MQPHARHLALAVVLAAGVLSHSAVEDHMLQMATTYIETSLFDHVQPRTDLTWESVSNVIRLYGFVSDALGYL